MGKYDDLYSMINTIWKQTYNITETTFNYVLSLNIWCLHFLNCFYVNFNVKDKTITFIYS